MSDEEIDKLYARIAELEAQIVQQAETIATLTPKPVVVSHWMNVYSWVGASEWHSILVSAQNCRDKKDYIGRLRLDTITHSCGRVEYKLEVEE